MGTRPSGRAPDELRVVRFTRQFTRHAEGSVLVEFGNTRVLCTASVEEVVPGFLRGKNQGWVTAEYGMLPRATHTRTPREAAKGKQSGRTQEIQRLIGRSLRAITDLSALGERTITLDCDVLLAPHHGSEQSDPPGFAAWSSPETVVMSGRRPDRTLTSLASYQQAGARVLHTALDGAVTCTLSPRGVDVTAHQRPPSRGAP